MQYSGRGTSLQTSRPCDRTDGTQRCRLPGIRPEEGTYSSTVPAVAERCGSHFECCSGGIRTNPNVPVFSVYTEVVQDAVVKYMREGRIKDASCSSLTVTNDTLKEVYDDIDYFKQHLTIRQSEISNSPEVIRRLGVIAMNTAIECDIYGNENSSHICGSKLMNGIGGSCDYERNGFISIFTTQSTTKNGCISAIVPMCSHVDSTEHDVDVIVTEQGVADLRGKGPLRRAKEIIENCAHPDYRPMLREYLKLAEKGHEPQSMRAALAMHDTFLKKGDMRLTDFGEYLK